MSTKSVRRNIARALIAVALPVIHALAIGFGATPALARQATQPVTQPSVTIAKIDPVADNTEGRDLATRLTRSYGGMGALIKMTAVRIHTRAATSRPVNVAPTNAPSGAPAGAGAAPGSTQPVIVQSENITTIVFPDRMRQETVSEQNGVKHHRIYVVTPEAEWQQIDEQPAMTHPFTHADAMRTIAGNLLYVLQQTDNKNFHFAAVGFQKARQKELLRLDISGPENVRMRWLIDPATGRIARRFDAIPNPTGGIDETATDFYDWASSADIVTPTRWRTVSRGVVSDVVCAYEVNPKIEPALFETPGAPASRPTAPPAR